jgi:phospholipid/cholesterol/gamma-HCH transport system substrate-binding protein
MTKKIDTEIKVGLFVALGLGLIMLAVLLMEGSQSFFGAKPKYGAHFTAVEGLIPGAKVVLSGVTVGAIDDISFDFERRDVYVTFFVSPKSKAWIKKDSTVEIATQGMLGDKYISIQAGSAEAESLPPGSDLPQRPSKDLTQFITKGDQLMVTLNSMSVSLDRILKSFEADNRSEIFFKEMTATAKNFSAASDKLRGELNDIQLKKTVGTLNQIFEKINNGTGTLGALVNDPALYDEIRALTGGANRNRIIRNLVRQTIKDSDEKAKSSGTQPSPKASE